MATLWKSGIHSKPKKTKEQEAPSDVLPQLRVRGPADRRLLLCRRQQRTGQQIREVALVGAQLGSIPESERRRSSLSDDAGHSLGPAGNVLRPPPQPPVNPHASRHLSPPQKNPAGDHRLRL